MIMAQKEQLLAILPPNDGDSMDYLLQLLQDEDVYQDYDSLSSVLEPFLEDYDNTTEIIDSVYKLLNANKDKDDEQNKVETTQRLVSTMTLGDDDAGEIKNDEVVTNEFKESSTTNKNRRQRRTNKKTKNNGNTNPVNDSILSENNDINLHEDISIPLGRGEYSIATNSIKSNIHLSSVNISLPNGTELLTDAKLDILKGHRYGLIGRNGVGKSTLLQRIAAKNIQGIPKDARILLVQQQIDGSDTHTSLQVLLEADTDRKYLLEEQSRLEQLLESSTTRNENLANIAEQLGDVATQLDLIEADQAEQRALEILQGLQFTEFMINGPTSNLSGGWRMRLSLARALFVSSDLLLFDECTNHLDLNGLDWLINYLQTHEDRTLIVVSHDRSFLDAVCTNIVCMEHQRLTSHVGSFSEYERQLAEKAARETQILDAAQRQRKQAETSIAQKQQSNDPNKQRQAKMIKEKKLDRIGNYRQDGKRYKLRSLKKLSEDSLRLAEKVEIQVDEAVIKLNFFDPAWPPGIGEHDALVRFEDFAFGFAVGSSNRTLFSGATLTLHRQSKVAMVGKNGAGKSTLMNIISGDLDPSEHKASGDFWMHPSLRIGHVTQYAVEELEKCGSQTVLEYAEANLMHGKASAKVIARGAGNVRQYLGNFGLGDTRHALQPINKLSGGERMRLCFATVLAEEPHLLLLDESTNHVDIETLDSMSAALDRYQGAVLMVSHNQAFLSGFCNELWAVEDGKITVSHGDTESFDELFSQYRSTILTDGKSRTENRRAKASLAKKASRQRGDTKQPTALL